MASILEARGVSFAYGPGQWAIRDMSFALRSPLKSRAAGRQRRGQVYADAAIERYAASA